MKCPLLTDKNYGAQLERHMATGDCLQADCAWWVIGIERCSILGVGLYINDLADKLDKLLYRLEKGGET